MKTVAIYRLLYGSDFIAESLSSVHPHCEQILCFVGRRPFGGRRVIKYFGHDVYLPHDIDGVTDAIAAWKKEHDPQDKVRIVPNRHATLLKGQLQKLINEDAAPRNPDCTHVMLVEPDEVWHEDAIAALMDQAARSDADEFLVEPNLFWRSPRYCSTRTNAYCALRALRGRRQVGPTGYSLMSDPGQGLKQASTGVRVHNFGYAASERTIFWKHVIALSVGRDLNLDSAPREEWFEDVWRAWDWDSNRRTDLCPSKGHEHAFPPATEYPFADLPSLMQERIRRAPLAEWATSGDAAAHWASPAVGARA